MPNPKPLSGRLILDCSALLPGPFIGKLLALQGARVLKIESPSRPDPARLMGPKYHDLNDCKELVEVELMDPEGRKKFEDLVRQADGLIEGFRPNAKLKLGLDEATLHRINPKLCITSLVGYPDDGPDRDRAGHDLNFQARTGCLSLFNEMPALPLGDLFVAYQGALAMASALDGVARGAKGARMVVSVAGALEEVQSGLVREFRETGEAPRYGGTLFSGVFPCYRMYAAKDGRKIAVGAIEPKFWKKICEITGTPELESQGFAVGADRDAAVAQLQAAFASRPWSEWAPLFDQADCCVEPVLTYGEVYGRV